MKKLIHVHGFRLLQYNVELTNFCNNKHRNATTLCAQALFSDRYQLRKEYKKKSLTKKLLEIAELSSLGIHCICTEVSVFLGWSSVS